MTQYYLYVHQPNHWPVISIEIRRSENRGRGYIEAMKGLDIETGKLAAAVVAPNISFRDEYTPDEAREIAEWWKIAATTAESLDALIATREDLSRPIVARMTKKTVLIDFEEAADG